jgi:hypothetical protein
LIFGNTMFGLSWPKTPPFMKLSSVTRYLLIGVLFPLLIQFVMYYRFTPSYQSGVYSETGFRSFFGGSVFKYRVVGSELQLWVYHQLKTKSSKIPFRESNMYGKRLLAMDDHADSLFYMSYFIINAFFAVLLGLALFSLFDRKLWFDMSDSDKSFTVVLIQFIVAVSQFVTTPYDVAGYFFEVMTFAVILNYIVSERPFYLIAGCILIMISTLVRESSALILSLTAAVYFTIYGFSGRWIKTMIFPLLSFISAYIGLRVIVNSHTVQISENNKLAQNFVLRPSAMMGLLIAVIFFYLMLKAPVRKDNIRLVRIFLILGLPYVVMIIFVGILTEFRLWVPLIIGTAILYKLNLKALRNLNYPSDLSANNTTDPQPY